MKYFVLWLLMLALAGCGELPAQRTPLEDLPADYSLEQALADGCVVYEDGSIAGGQEVWDAFCRAVSGGQKAGLRLVFRYNLGDPARYDPDYYASVKDQYPRVFAEDLDFDGEAYTVRWYEEGEEITKIYRYLMKYEGPAESPGASFDRYVRYVLTHDDTVTWEDIWRGMISSQFGARVDAHTVYVHLISD